MATERITPQGAAQLRVPDFFIVGHAKSGTTALYEMLRKHPQIYMPEAKEPWFFASDMRPRFQPPMAGHLPETLEEYLSLFAEARPEQRVGEASSSYLWSHTAAGRIAEVGPDARIIAVLREPASFLRSLHLQLLQTHVETSKDFRHAIELEAARREGRHIPRRSHRPQLLQYSEHVRYTEQLRRYHALFPPERVLILLYDEFLADNDATVRGVFRFLGVDETHPVEVIKANPTVRMRSQRLDSVVHSVSVGAGPLSRAAKGTVKALTPQRLRRDALRVARRRVVHGSPGAVDERFMNELRQRFRGEVEALSEYLERDLVTLWGYDRIGGGQGGGGRGFTGGVREDAPR
ncbi:MAG: sulfotransferase [Solirubrobacteraceae bacterium]